MATRLTLHHRHHWDSARERRLGALGIVLLVIVLAGTLAMLNGCAAPPRDPDTPTPAVLHFANAVAEAEARLAATEPGTAAHAAAQRTLDDTRAALAVAVRVDDYNRVIRDEDGRIDPGKAIETGAGAISAFLPPPWSQLALLIGGVAGAWEANRRGKRKGQQAGQEAGEAVAEEIVRAIQAARAADPAFEERFNATAGNVMKTSTASPRARAIIDQVKTGG